MTDSEFSQDYHELIAGKIAAAIEIDVVRLSGNDRTQVMNNLCTADIKKLESGEGTETFVTDVRGKCVGHVCAFHIDSDVVLIGTAGQSERLASHIDRYVIREDVQIHADDSATRALLWSGRADACPISEFSPLASPRLACGEGMLDDLPMHWFQMPFTSPTDCLIIPRYGEVESSTQKQLPQKSCDSSAFETARIEAGWPIYGIDLNETNLPQEVCRNEQAISFAKGCYLGQETVARLDALGQVQKKLVRLTIESEGNALPPVGTELICDEKVCGEIRSSSLSAERDNTIALGYVKRNWLEKDAPLALADESGTATIVKA